jgi:putative DNA primase/helicase
VAKAPRKPDSSKTGAAAPGPAASPAPQIPAVPAPRATLGDRIKKRRADAIARLVADGLPKQVAIGGLAVSVFEEIVRYDHQLGEFLVWSSHRWRDNREGANADVVMLMIQFLHDLVQAGRDVFKPSQVLSLTKLGYAEQLVGVLKIDDRMRTGTALWDADPYLLGTPGGTIDLRDGSRIASQPENYIRGCTLVTPAAGPAPMWTRFLDQVTEGDASKKAFLQQLAGCCLIGNNADQVFVFLHGMGGNGKGVFTRVLGTLMGSYAVTADPALFIHNKGGAAHPAGLMRILMARAVFASEVPANAAWNDQLIKDFTGGDRMAARELYGQFVELTPRGTPVLSGNERPALSKVNKAIARRFLLVPFDADFTDKPVLNLDQKLLKAEGPQILQWAIDGAVARVKAERLETPAVIKAASQEYLEEEDMLGQFLLERCELGPDLVVGSSQLFEAWCDYSRAARRDPGTHTAFTLHLRGRPGVTPHKTNKGKVFKGLQLRPEGFGGFDGR